MNNTVNKNESGFGAIEGLLILIIILLVGFIGFYVWHAKDDANKNLKSSVSTSKVTTSGTKTPTVQKSANGWSNYSSVITKGHMSFQYPTIWGAPNYITATSQDTPRIVFANSKVGLQIALCGPDECGPDSSASDNATCDTLYKFMTKDYYVAHQTTDACAAIVVRDNGGATAKTGSDTEQIIARKAFVKVSTNYVELTTPKISVGANLSKLTLSNDFSNGAQSGTPGQDLIKFIDSVQAQ